MPRWRSIRLGGGGGRSSPLRGRPRLRLGFGSGAGLSDFAGFSRASIAVLSREICPTKRSEWMSWISASCNRDGKALAANSAKARENVDSLGTSPARYQPHKRRNVLSADSISINRLAVGMLNLFRDIFPAARCVLVICFLSTTNTPQLAAGIFYYGLRDKGPRQDGALARRTPGKAMPGGQERLDPDHAQNADQLPVMSIQRAARRIVEPRQKFLLNVQPVGG